MGRLARYFTAIVLGVTGHLAQPQNTQAAVADVLGGVRQELREASAGAIKTPTATTCQTLFRAVANVDQVLRLYDAKNADQPPAEVAKAEAATDQAYADATDIAKPAQVKCSAAGFNL